MKRHLFAEHGFIDSSEGIELTVNQPVRAEPVIVREYSWERILLGLYLTVIDDGGTIRIWYGCRSKQAPEGKHTALAESEDGVSFTKRGIVIPETMEGSLLIDPNAPEGGRYAYIGNHYRKGIFRWSSPDGVRFTRDEVPLLGFESDTQCVFSWEEDEGRYVGYVRGWNYGATKNDHRRTVIRLTHDRLDEPWPYRPSTEAKPSRLPHFSNESEVVLEADAEDPEETDIYTMAPCRYGDFRFAFPTYYRHFREPDDGPYRNGGRTAVRCAGSHDGIGWRLYDRRSYLSPGVGEQMVYLGQGIVCRGEEIWHYGIAYRTHHGEVEKRIRHGDGTMYRFVQRRDGFVSADSRGRGSLVTRPLRCEGRELYLNVDTGGIGLVRVGLLDERGSPIPGYGADACEAVAVNDTRARVSWRGVETGRLSGREVRLAIEVDRSRLYSAWFEGR